jgi:hypothetical protein
MPNSDRINDCRNGSNAAYSSARSLHQKICLRGFTAKAQALKFLGVGLMRQGSAQRQAVP